MHCALGRADFEMKMARVGIIAIICYILMDYCVLSVVQLDTIRHFQVEEENIKGSQLLAEKTLATVGLNLTSTPAVSATDAAGQYRLSYGDRNMAWRQFKLDHSKHTF